jgi:tRNA-binding EMAP/Myf-like protein
MKVVEKNAHDKTDNLFIYTFESPNIGQIQIVANLTNVYAVGDVVAIAQLGTFLPGLEMKPRKVFGIPSQGMALGPVDADLDTDFSERFNADAPVGTFRVTYSVEVEARYAEGAAPVAAKAIGKKHGTVVSVERVSD